ncbi:peptide chain release factor family protein [Kiritimatiella glycovorans]|uniref:Peptide chain release factor 2 n=1 Tax=Kiritimatiella glycovorans TaxID=1307763 RepID=A0A0G3EG38_9BACT|nr:peptide chain release factor-like protein [Kiritimatiella glycovorans]AKJ65411.1 Peptide chain release factor 2 [Kiritimatiella glycovorans]
MIRPAKREALQREMTSLGIEESDLEESFIKGSGSGGQKINKTSSCVQLRHIPSGIEVRCQRSRSRADNRYFARRELCRKIEEQRKGEKSEKRREIEKIRRAKRRRSRRAKERMLQNKKHQAEKKRRRREGGEYFE